MRQAGLRRTATGGMRGGGLAPPIVHEVLGSAGQALDAASRRHFESHFGRSFSGVRLHVDARAAESARAVDAAAYAVGRHVVFGAGQYAPHTTRGRHLLAHELAHTVQQQSGAADVPRQLWVGAADDRAESDAERAAEHAGSGTTEIDTAPRVRRDLARPPRGAPAADVVLTDAEVADAIAFNEQRFSDPYSIALVRDAVGVSRFPAVVDEELVEAVRQWQAERSMTQDGKIGHLMTRSLFLELVAEDQMRDAVFLLIDSYALPVSIHLQNVRVGSGAGCCSTAAVAVADAVTSNVGGGQARAICVCRTSVPRSEAGYNHFVRIVLHELVHVPQRAAGIATLEEQEFEAFFVETCRDGRAPHLSAADRVAHANIAIAHFNAMPAADRTPARQAQRNRLVALVAAGGVGPC